MPRFETRASGNPSCQAALDAPALAEGKLRGVTGVWGTSHAARSALGSELQPGTDLDGSITRAAEDFACRCDRQPSIPCIRNRGAGTPQIEMIECVKEISPKLEPYAFCDPEAFECADVPVPKAGTEHRIARRITPCPGRWRRKRVRIEPLNAADDIVRP